MKCMGDKKPSKEVCAIADQLPTCPQIPSVGGLLYLVKDILDLQDINLTELEISILYPNKSQLLARVFTALLLTPHQRKR